MCTRIFWNTNPGLFIVGRNEDYVTASHPTLVATPCGVKRWGTVDAEKRSKSMAWTVTYGNIAVYANNRFPNDGLNEVGLTRAYTLLPGRRSQPNGGARRQQERVGRGSLGEFCA